MVKFRLYDPDDEQAKAKPQSKAEVDAFIQQATAHAGTPEPETKSAAASNPVPAAAKPAHRGFTLEWIGELGWSGNPFTELQPRPAHQFIVGQETARQEINLFFIKGSSFGTLSGDKGSGKTFMLAWLSEELAQYKNKFLVYTFNGDVTVHAFSETLTKPYAKFFSKYRGKTPEELAAYVSIKLTQKLVILIDNADKVKELEPYLEALVTNGHAIVILAGKSPHAFQKDELGATLRTFFGKDALALLEKRIESVGGSGIKPFDEKLVLELWKAAKQDIPTFLRYSSDAAVKLALKQLVLEPAKEEATEDDSDADESPKKGKGAKKVEKSAKKGKASKTAEKEKASAPAKKSPYDDFIAGLDK